MRGIFLMKPGVLRSGEGGAQGSGAGLSLAFRPSEFQKIAFEVFAEKENRGGRPDAGINF